MQNTDETKTQKEPTAGSRWRSIPWGRLAIWARRFCRRRLLPIALCLLCLVLIVAGFAIALNVAVLDKTRDRIYTPEQMQGSALPFDHILILGCGVRADGTPTPMLYDRIVTGVSMYDAGLAPRVLMSGDHATEDYNEVDPMRDEAILMGVPAGAIEQDPLGLSTYESLARYAKAHPGARVLIVTQEYHLPRALYLADKLGLDAQGVSADRRSYREQPKYDAREFLARCKDVFWAQARPEIEE